MDLIIREYNHDTDALVVETLIIDDWEYAYANIYQQSVFDDKRANLKERAERNRENKYADFGAKRLVAELDGKVVGFMIFVTKSLVSYFQDKGYGELLVFYVDKHYHKQGIGKALFDYCKAELKKAGLENFSVGVLKDNVVGRAAYEKYGGKLTDYTTFHKAGDVEAEEVYYEYEL